MSSENALDTTQPVVNTEVETVDENSETQYENGKTVDESDNEVKDSSSTGEKVLSESSVNDPKGISDIASVDSTRFFKGRITMYTFTGCPFCTNARTNLKKLDLPFIEINLDMYPKERLVLKERLGGNAFTVPQIFFNSKCIGGSADLQKLINDPVLWAQELSEVSKNPVASDAPRIPDASEAIAQINVEELLEGKESDDDKTIESFNNSGMIKAKMKISAWKSESKVFSGSDLLTWMKNTKGMAKNEGEQEASRLMKEGYFVYVGHEKSGFYSFLPFASKAVDGIEPNHEFDASATCYYRLLHQEFPDALNTHDICTEPIVKATVLAEQIRRLLLVMYDRCLTPDGKYIDYEEMKKGVQYKTFLRLIVKLQRVQLDGLSSTELIAFWINVFNSLAVHATMVVGPPISKIQRYLFFKSPRYVVSGYSYSLLEIHNGILRNNKRPPPPFATVFSDNDPRLKFSIQDPDPRINTALRTGAAKGCPPVKIFTVDGLESELTMAFEIYISSDAGLKLVEEANEIHLSQIFSWFRSDFGKDRATLVEFIFKYCPPRNKAQMEKLMKNNAKVVFMNYEWGGGVKAKPK